MQGMLSSMRSSCVREIVLLRENHNVCNSSTDCNKSQQAKKGESYKKNIVQPVAN